MILPRTILKIRSDSPKSFAQFNISYVIFKSFVCNLYVILMSLVSTRMSFVCHPYVFVNHLCAVERHSHVIRMYSYVILISLACTRVSSVCQWYVLACHSYVTRMYSYVIRTSLVCTRMSSVCHSHVLVCHPYVTRMYSYVIRMSLAPSHNEKEKMYQRFHHKEKISEVLSKVQS